MLRPIRAFTQLEAAGGILLIVGTLIALLWANSPWALSYSALWHTKLTFGFGDAKLSKDLHFWINDGLMAVFFLLVGLEIKREALIGELASFRKAALPIAGAIGGILLPASIYTFFNRGGPGSAGWGIPMATDIAFALGVLALLGKRVPTSLKVFLAALAIADDIGAVLVIAFFYTDHISWMSLGMAAAFFLSLIVMNLIGARHPLIYAILGVGLWLAFLQSGVHATVAGVLLAMTIPGRQRIDAGSFLARSEESLQKFRSAGELGDTPEAASARSHALERLVADCEKAESPMLRFEHALIPWSQHFIMPVFALSNAGVELGRGATGALLDPIGQGIFLGLVIGKPIGIFALSWIAVRAGLASLPTGVTWGQILGAGMLGGIGFTMSLFIANLSFDSPAMLEFAKVGILGASLISGIAGAVLLSRLAAGRRPAVG